MTTGNLTAGRRRAARLCTAALRAELAGLGVQFLLGMYVNLFVPRLNWQPVLIAHMVLGIGLVCGAAVAAASAIVSRDGRRIAVTGAGLAALVLAATGGIRFVFAGQDNVYSYLMAVGFILAVAVFGAGSATSKGATGFSAPQRHRRGQHKRRPTGPSAPIAELTAEDAKAFQEGHSLRRGKFRQGAPHRTLTRLNPPRDLAAGRSRDVHDRPAPVCLILTSLHQPYPVEIAHHLAGRRQAHPEAPRQLAHSHRAIMVQENQSRDMARAQRGVQEKRAQALRERDTTNVAPNRPENLRQKQNELVQLRLRR